MNWTEIVSILAAAIAVSFGAVGPALAEGGAVAAADGRHRAAAGSGGDDIAHTVRRPCDDRDNGNLLSGDRAPGTVRKSVYPLS